MNRRGFLTRSGLALGALIVGDEVLETLDRLTHRKVWAGHTFSPARWPSGLFDVPSNASIHGLDTKASAQWATFREDVGVWSYEQQKLMFDCIRATG